MAVRACLENKGNTSDLAELAEKVAGMSKKELSNATWMLRKHIQRKFPVEMRVLVQKKKRLEPVPTSFAVKCMVNKLQGIERGEDASIWVYCLERMRKQKEEKD